MREILSAELLNSHQMLTADRAKVKNSLPLSSKSRPVGVLHKNQVNSIV